MHLILEILWYIVDVHGITYPFPVLCRVPGVISLDLDKQDLPSIVTHVVDQLVLEDYLPPEEKGAVLKALLLKHRWALWWTILLSFFVIIIVIIIVIITIIIEDYDYYCYQYY